MNQKGFANIVLIAVVVILVGAVGYFAFVKKSEPVAQQPTPSQNQQVSLRTPSTPTLTFNQGAKPFIQINFDYSIAKLFNIYRSISATNGWQKVISNFPSNAHTAVDYDYPKDAKVLYYRIVSVDEQGQESAPSPIASVAVTAQSETVNWQSYFDSQNLPSAPLGVMLPQNCRVVGSGSKMVDLAYKIFAGFEWSVDCGSRNNNARGTLGPALEQQGWKFCDSQTATGHWWKNGVITGIAESAGVSYPFKVTQRSGADCSSN